MKATILGCGYVGKAMAHHWRSQGFQITVTTTTSDRVAELEPIADRVVVVEGGDPAGLQSLLQDQQVLLVSVGASRARDYETTYLQTATTLSMVLLQVPTVQQVIYTGSYALYGDRQGAWVDEDTPPKPTNRNGEVLLETERRLLELSSRDRPVCVFRLGGIYGPGRELIQIFRQAAGTPRPDASQDASNWIHLDDIVGAIAWAQQHRLQGVYNLVQDNALSFKTLLDRLFETHQLPPVQWDKSQPSTRPYNARVSNAKLKAAGYHFLHSELIL